ncbi:MAG: hypothetical protein ABIT01_12185, partial [Thermoanaerobaculia bacterium]
MRGSRVLLALTALAVLGLSGWTLRAGTGRATAEKASGKPAAATGAAAAGELLKKMTGVSTKLRSLIVTPEQAESLREAGVELTEPGIYPFLVSPSSPKSAGSGLSIVVLTPFTKKIAGKIEGYVMGSWPEEQSSGKKSPYTAPTGFIKVTSSTAKRNASEHFDFGDFLTKDQAKVWPKYLVLDPRLLD